MSRTEVDTPVVPHRVAVVATCRQYDVEVEFKVTLPLTIIRSTSAEEALEVARKRYDLEAMKRELSSQYGVNADKLTVVVKPTFIPPAPPETDPDVEGVMQI